MSSSSSSSTSSARRGASSRPQITSLMYALPVRRLKEILGHVLPELTLGPVETLSSPQLARLYQLTMSDNRKLLLSFAPSLAVRLLRHEATLLSTEAILVDFICKLEGKPTGKECRIQINDPECEFSLLGTAIPSLLKHSSNNREMAYPYSIFEPTLGVPLSTLSIYLSTSERHSIDKQVGQLARALACITSPSGTFGMVNRVLEDPFIPNGAVAKERSDSETWSEGFNTLLEGILRDGEDMNVLLPYETIRAHYKRLSWHLDGVITPRLVVLDIADDTNVMVERVPSSSTQPPHPLVTGLRSWSQGIFGDPQLANTFVDTPSSAFLEGWAESGDDVAEDLEGAEIRMMLYSCYRAAVMIVTEYYRPQADSSRREMEGRRKLTRALAALERVVVDRDGEGEGEALKRVRSLSLEVKEREGVVKRIKIEELID